MQLFDALTAMSLIFTAIATPFEVGFLPAPESSMEPLFIANRIVDCVFLCDMGVPSPPLRSRRAARAACDRTARLRTGSLTRIRTLVASTTVAVGVLTTVPPVAAAAMQFFLSHPVKTNVMEHRMAVRRADAAPLICTCTCLRVPEEWDGIACAGSHRSPRTRTSCGL